MRKWEQKVSKSKIIFIILRILSIIFFIPLTILIIYIGFQNLNSKENGPVYFNKYSIKKVVSGSMEPEIMTGEFVLFDHVSFSEIEEGDNIAYRSDILKNSYGDDMIIFHKVIEKINIDGEIFLRMQGVSNDFVDTELVSSDNYIAKGVYHSFQNPAYYYIGFVGFDFALLYLIMLLKKMQKKLKNEEKILK